MSVIMYDIQHEPIRALTTDDEHIQDLDDAGVVHCLENFDLAQSSDGHALLLIVHENTFEGYQTPSKVMDCFVDLSEQGEQSHSVAVQQA